MTWLLAYENGAKYIIVFDSNKDWTQNVLTQTQLDAIKEFWQYTQANPRTDNPSKRQDSIRSSRRLRAMVFAVQKIKFGDFGKQIILLST